MSRSFFPGINPYFFACSAHVAGRVDGQHPLLQRLLHMAPGRAEVLALLGEEVPHLPAETTLQQTGGQMFRLFVRDLPASYRQRGQELEARFRVMLDHAWRVVMEARFALGQEVEADNPARHAMVMAYVAAQHVIGARCMAMDLYNSQ